MKRLTSYLFVASLLVTGYACSSAKEAPTVCPPNDISNCLCAAGPDGTPIKGGTRKCRADGKSFEACRVSETEPCPFGEIGEDGGVINNDGGTSAGDSDVCPGVAIAVPANQTTKVKGDTTNAKDDYNGEGSCALGQGSPDVVYKIVPAGTGKLNIQLFPDSDWSPFMYLREGTCDDIASQAECVPPTGPGQRKEVNTTVVLGREYYLVIDGAAGQANKGAFDLELTLTTGKICGDGNVDDGETCDDGNKVMDDGCSNDCKSFSGNPVSGGSCPGQPVHIWGTNPVTGTGATDRAKWPVPAGTSTFTGTNASCALVANAGANDDHVYAVTMHTSGNILIKVTGATFDTQIIGRKVCLDAASQKQGTGGTVNRCANDSVGDTGNEQLCIGGAKDETYYVAVDSNNNGALNKGEYTISFQASNCAPKL